MPPFPGMCLSVGGRGKWTDHRCMPVKTKQKKRKVKSTPTFFMLTMTISHTLGMKMIAGRYFSRDFGGDSAAVVINEAAVRDLGWKNNEEAINKTIISSGQHAYKVIGVVQDFNYASAKQRIVPLLMMLSHNNGTVMVKLKTTDIPGFLADVKKEWNALHARTPFSYYFLDDKFASLYAAEEKTGQIFTLFAVVAVVIASLGLFGLVAFTTEQTDRGNWYPQSAGRFD